MAVQLNIPFETLVELVEQLPDEQQLDLVRHLQQRTQQRQLTAGEKMQRMRTAQFHGIVKEEPSPRR
ncbi:MAG: hypothetical protein HY866_05615, partial [Chloroflexi bacterium]|nr:hypothetical protein [Chloroflexota bacterium]